MAAAFLTAVLAATAVAAPVKRQLSGGLPGLGGLGGAGGLGGLNGSTGGSLGGLGGLGGAGGADGLPGLGGAGGAGGLPGLGGSSTGGSGGLSGGLGGLLGGLGGSGGAGGAGGAGGLGGLFGGLGGSSSTSGSGFDLGSLLGGLGGGATNGLGTPTTEEAAAAPSSSSAAGGLGGFGGLGSLTSGLGGLGGSSTSNDVTDGGACKKVTLLFARGTTEPGNMGSTVGPALATALKKQYNNDVAIQGIDYPADFAGTATGSITPAQAQGAVQMNKLASQLFTSCPDTKIVLSGYSQGAQQVHGALINLGANGNKIAAAVTFGDPLQAQKFQNIDAGKTKIFCNQGDGVCQDAFIISAAHLSYAQDSIQPATQFIATQIPA